MKKVLSIILTAAIAGTLFVGCGNVRNKTSDNKNISTLEKIKSHKKIKIGLEDTYPPMEFRNEKNELVGFDIDVSKEIAKKLGAEPDFVITEFGGLTMALNAGKFDMSISAISVDEKRSKEVDFSEPYVKSGQAVIVKNNNSNIKSEGDLKGKNIGCQLGTTGEKAARKVEGVKDVKTYEKATHPFQDLQIGRIDAIIVDEVVGRYYMGKDKGKFKIATTLNQEPIAIAFKKGDKQLEEEVKKAMGELYKDGTMSKLSEKWFGEDIYKDMKK